MTGAPPPIGLHRGRSGAGRILLKPVLPVQQWIEQGGTSGEQRQALPGSAPTRGATVVQADEYGTAGWTGAGAAGERTLGGPEATYDPGHLCLTGDHDGDADVDLGDFAGFQRLFVGSGP